MRVIDVNPLSPTGIFVEDIQFIHILMIYLMNLPERDFTEIEQIQAVKRIKEAAVFGNEKIRQKAEQILADIMSFVSEYFQDYTGIVNYQLKKVKHGNSYAEIISERFSSAYMEKGLELAKEYQRSVGYV